MQTYVSDILYHLVGFRNPDDHEQNFETLCKILDSQEIRPRNVAGSHGPITLRIDYNAALDAGEPISQTVTCFCDIELTQLKPIHTKKYGLFGVGVDRHLVATWGGRPVIYIPITRSDPTCYWNSFDKQVMTTTRALEHYFDEREVETTRTVGSFPSSALEAVDDALSLIRKELLAFMKFFDVDLPDESPENYYMEREWRKFGKLALHITLRKVLVAKGYGERLVNRYPQYASMVVELDPP